MRAISEQQKMSETPRESRALAADARCRQALLAQRRGSQAEPLGLRVMVTCECERSPFRCPLSGYNVLALFTSRGCNWWPQCVGRIGADMGSSTACTMRMPAAWSLRG